MDERGFTLLELMLVLATLAILMAVMMPSFVSYKENIKREVCHINSKQLEKRYYVLLGTVDTDEQKELFKQCLDEYGGGFCPNGGEIRYYDGKVRCSIHPVITDSEGDGGAPYL